MDGSDLKAEMVAFQERWRLVHLRELEELRGTAPLDKLQMLAALIASVHDLGWEERLQEEDGPVRRRWNQLRRASIG